MTEGAEKDSSAPSRYLPVLLVLFAASGASALIYEIVWYQLLELAIGASAISLAFLLATFMGGLCLGSFALPRIKLSTHPLRVYAFIEALIGVLGLIELVLIPLIGRAYLAGPQAGFAGMVLRGAVAAICLMPPTLLMGASLPAVARWIDSAGRGVSWWG